MCVFLNHQILSFLQMISPTALFLAAKVEEQARKLEHVIKVAHACLHPLEPLLDTKCDVCKNLIFDIIFSTGNAFIGI